MNFDLHTHTTYSDGKADVEMMVFCAEALELSAFAITDHLNEGKPTDWIDEMVERVKRARAGRGFPVLCGVEAEIIDESGGTTLTEEVRSKLDIALAHWSGKGLPWTSDKNEIIEHFVECMVNICSNPLVDVIAHPFNIGRAPAEIALDDISTEDYRRIARAFRDGGKYFEVMNNMWWWFPDTKPSLFREQYLRIVRIFASEGVKFSIGSDAHSVGGAGNIAWSQRLLRDAGVGEEQLIDPASFL